MDKQQSFKQLAQERQAGGLVRDLIFFMKENKKWWLLPFVLVFVLMGGLMLLSGTGAAPFIYTLF